MQKALACCQDIQKQPCPFLKEGHGIFMGHKLSGGHKLPPLPLIAKADHIRSEIVPNRTEMPSSGAPG